MNNYDALLAAVKSKIDAELGGINVVTRQRLYLDRQRGESLPTVIICQTKPIILEKFFEDVWYVRYPFLVAYISDNDFLLRNTTVNGDTTLLMSNALSTISLGTSFDVTDYLIDYQPKYDASGLDTTLAISVIEPSYLVIQNKGE